MQAIEKPGPQKAAKAVRGKRHRVIDFWSTFAGSTSSENHAAHTLNIRTGANGESHG